MGFFYGRQENQSIILLMVKATQRGFTIVELLIVIVIISVLASITVVAFNGVQKRSQEAQVNSAVKSSIKLVELALAKGVTPVGGNSCITTSAADYPVTADFASGAC